MPTNLNITANEEGCIVIAASFTDATDAPIVPESIHWKLVNAEGTVINNRTDTTITPASTVNIVLSGNDLEVAEATVTAERYLTVWGTFNSSYGLGLPYTDEVFFRIKNLKGK